jgi:hypothetical protein
MESLLSLVEIDLDSDHEPDMMSEHEGAEKDEEN